MTEQTPQSNIWSSSAKAEHWQEDAKRRQQDMAEATQRMLAAAELKTGDHILDIGAGTGDQSILAAQRVGPTGSVLATDISADMLAIAARVAQEQGLNNLTTRAMDAEQLDLADNTFDAIISRLALMLIPHHQQALQEIHRVLKPGGKLAALVWSRPENNPLFSVPLAILSKYAKGDSPNPFKLSDPFIFEEGLTRAGFTEIKTVAFPFQSRYASFDAFMQSTASRLTASLLGEINQQLQQQLREELRQALSRFEETHSFTAPAEMLLAVGRKASLNNPE